MSVYLACVPVLMPKPPNYDPKYPCGEPPPMVVHKLTQSEPRRHVHWDAWVRKGPLAEPCCAIVTLTPNTGSHPLHALHWIDPWCAGPNAVMQVPRPSSAPLPAYPWEVRPKLVPMPASDQSNIIATVPVVRGGTLISMPLMALHRSTSSDITHYSMHALWDRRTYLDDAVVLYKPPPP